MLTTLMLLTMLAPEVGQSSPNTAATVCANAQAELVGYLESPQSNGLSTETAVIVDGNAYAEHNPTCGEGCTATGEASLFSMSGNRSAAASIAGASSVAVPGFTAHPLTFLLFQKSGKARLRWTVLGKMFEADVDRCSGGLWTAAQGSKSAIIVQITKNPEPPK